MHTPKRSSVLYTLPQDEADNVTATTGEDGVDLRTNSSSTKRQSAKTKDCCAIGAKVPARLVLYFLSWSGFLVSFMMRNDINFALVAMTRPINVTATNNTFFSINSTTITTIDNTTTTTFEPLSTTTPIPAATSLWQDTKTTTTMSTITQILNASTQLTTNISANTVIKALNDASTARHDYIVNNNDDDDDMYKYAWSTTVQSIIISSFYWCYVLSQVVGGIATQYFGTKQVFGWSQFATALCSLCIPVCADFHYAAVILLRSIQGFASGLTWPAMYAIVGFWIPLSERSRFMSSFQGFSIGIGLTYPLCGFVIDTFGWRYVFYTTGTLGMSWCLLWYLLAFNTPQEHPRITPKELDYIESNVSTELKEAMGMKVPWKRIFTSKPAWAIAITTFGRIWIHYIFIVCGPNFMKNILKFNYQANGFLSGMPFMCSYISSVFFCYIADKMMLHRLMSLTNVRKIFTALSQIVPGVLIYWIGYIDENIILLLVIWFIAVTYITASYAGAMANIVDIAPNLAGPVLAFCQTIHMSASFLSPLVSGIIITNVQSIDQWRTVFGISSVITILTYIVYQCYGTAEIQKWNYAQPRNEGSSEEDEEQEASQILKKTTENPLENMRIA